MNSMLVFHRPKTTINIIADKFKLKPILKNERTSIYENDRMRFSFDKSVIRVTIFDDTDITLVDEIRDYMYNKSKEI